MKYFRLVGFCLGFILSGSLGLVPLSTVAQDGARSWATRRPKPAPELPSVIQIPSTTGRTADDAVEYLAISKDNPFDSSNPKSRPNTDLVKLDAQEVRDLLNRTGRYAKLRDVPNSELHVFIGRYEEGAQEVADVMIEAKKAGIGSVSLMTDGNVCVKDDGNGRYIPLENTEEGKILAQLLANGFEITNGRKGEGQVRYRVVVSPVSLAEMKPIEHQKDLYIWRQGPGGPLDISTATVLVYINSSANHIPGHLRMNFSAGITHPQVIANSLAHSLSMAATFEKGGKISDIPAPPRNRYTWPDGTFIEEMWTDGGKANPSDRIDALLKLITDKPTEIQLLDFGAGQFAWTKGSIVQSLNAALKAHNAGGHQLLDPTAKPNGFFVWDQHFASPVSYAVAAALVGVDVNRPHGAPVWGLGEKERSLINAFVWQKMAGGEAVLDPDGPPNTTHVYHIKTFFLVTLEKVQGPDGVERIEKFIHIFNGSWNLSNHTANADVQIHYKLKSDSPFGLAVIEAIRESVLNGKKLAEAAGLEAPGVPALQGTFRMMLGAMIGKSWSDISLNDTDGIFKALESNQLEGVQTIVSRIIADPKNHLVNRLRVPSNEAEARLKRLIKFLQWYGALPAEKRAFKNVLSPHRVIAALKALAYPDHSPFEAKSALHSVLWRPGLSPDQIEDLTKEAWGELEMNKPYPTANPELGATGGEIARPQGLVGVQGVSDDLEGPDSTDAVFYRRLSPFHDGTTLGSLETCIPLVAKLRSGAAN